MKKPDTKYLWNLSSGHVGSCAAGELRNTADWIDAQPDLEGKHVCEWPADLTRERLLVLASEFTAVMSDRTAALRALAAIAPKAPKKKRMVQLWECRSFRNWTDDEESAEQMQHLGWTRVGGPVEVEE